MIVLLFVFMFLSCSNLTNYDYKSTFENNNDSINVFITKTNVTPVELIYVKIEPSINTEIDSISFENSSEKSLKLKSNNKVNNIYYFTFDSDLPNKYVLPTINVITKNGSIIVDNISINVYSLAASEDELKNLKENNNNYFRPINFLYIFISIITVIIIVILILFFLRKKLLKKETFTDIQLLNNALSSLRENVVTSFNEEQSYNYAFMLSNILRDLIKLKSFDNSLSNLLNEVDNVAFSHSKIEKLQILEKIAKVQKLIGELKNDI